MVIFRVPLIPQSINFLMHLQEHEIHLKNLSSTILTSFSIKQWRLLEKDREGASKICLRISTDKERKD